MHVPPATSGTDQLVAVAVAAAELLDDLSELDVVLLSLEPELGLESLDSLLEPFDFFPASRLSVR